MKKQRYGILTVLGVVGILVLSIAGMRLVKQGRDAAMQAAAGNRDIAIPVQTGIVQRASIDNLLTFNGDIQALQQVNLQPKVSGRLLSLSRPDGVIVEEGTIVKKGELIGQIDDRDIHAQVSSARANVAASRAGIASAQAKLENARANLEQARAEQEASSALTASARTVLADRQRELSRQKGLIERQATTQQSYDQAETASRQSEALLRQAQAEEASKAAEVRSAEAEILQAEANLEQAQASCQQAEAVLEQSEVSYSETKLYSPLDGVVSAKHVDPGSMVSPTTPILTVVSMAEVKVLLSVPVNYLPQIIPGKTAARLSTVSLPGREIECSISKIYPSLDLATRTAKVELRVPNRLTAQGEYELKPGMYVTVQVLVESKRDVVAIDVALPIRNLDRQLVYVVSGDSVRAVPVQLGIRFQQMVEILSGLEGGEEIVVVGQHRLTDGSRIRRVEGNNLQMPANPDDAASKISAIAE